MSTFEQVLAGILSGLNEPTDEQIAQAVAIARATTQGSEAAKPRAPTDPAVAARARFEEIEKSPLPAGAPANARAERATERAKLLRIIHNYDDSTPGFEGPRNFGRPTGGNAA